MTSHTEQTPQKENATVFFIVVLMFILIVPMLGAIAKSSSKNHSEKGSTVQQNEIHGESESHGEHHGNH